MFPWAHRVHNPNGILIGSSVFAQLPAKCHRACRAFPLKISPSSGGPGPHLIRGSLGPSVSQMASPSVQPFLHSSRQRVPILYNGPPHPPKIALSRRLSRPQLIGLHGSLGPPESTTQTAYRAVQPFCTAHGSIPIFYNGLPIPPKLPFPWGILTRHPT